MSRYYALWKETRILWIAMIIVGVSLSYLHSSFLFASLVTLPICVWNFIYFSHVRYDKDGNRVDP